MIIRATVNHGDSQKSRRRFEKLEDPAALQEIESYSDCTLQCIWPPASQKRICIFRCTNGSYAQFIPIDKDLILATENCIPEFNLTLDFDPHEKSICAIVFPKRSKSRVIFEALLHDLRAARAKGISRHRFREFAYELSRGKFVWHNAPFKCSQRQVYKVLTVLLKLGMLRLEKRPGDRDPRYYVSIMDFSSNLNRVAKKWEKEFAEAE